MTAILLLLPSLVDPHDVLAQVKTTDVQPFTNQHYLTVLHPLEKDMSRPEISVLQPSQGTLMTAVDGSTPS